MKKTIQYILFFSLLLPLPAIGNTPMMNEVYAQLKVAIGDSNRDWPTLAIRPGANSVLSFNKRKNIIFVDEKALEVCQSFGAQEQDAFAFLLAHEMTHFYQEHDWQEAGFATSFLSNKHHFEVHVADEKEADLYGAFITHIAGFQSIKIVPNLFDKVYKAYGLQEQLRDYPSLQERKATALEICEKVKELIQVFETANYLNVLGEHISAAAAYEYVLQFVKYKELYNNIGGSLVAAAALQTNYGEKAFHYPIELDVDLPLRDGVEVETKDLLKKAIEYLIIASQMDNQHYATYVNLACAYTLDKDVQKAKELIQQLQSISSTPKQAAEIAIVEGIRLAQAGELNSAVAQFVSAKTLSQEAGIQALAEYNIGIAKGNISSTEVFITHSVGETINGIELTYQNDFPFKEVLLQDEFLYQEKNLGLYSIKNSLLTHLETEDKLVAILTTQDQSQRTQAGIGIGATYQQIQTVYPASGKTFNHSKGSFLLLPSHKLLFNLNNQNQVTAWGTYEIY